MIIATIVGVRPQFVKAAFFFVSVKYRISSSAELCHILWYKAADIFVWYNMSTQQLQIEQIGTCHRADVRCFFCPFLPICLTDDYFAPNVFQKK